ncbi:MAG: hypothetical protein FD181_2804 [Prolixibacteraceae bacterium]|nr:MAG: hypothetical protein FD181_2804 [Prolixibacteraceae bacterium]
MILLLVVSGLFAQTPGPMKMKPEMTEIWDPEVRVITPGETPSQAPSDAIILFDGTNLEAEWTNGNGEKPEWIVADGCVTVKKGTGTIKTKRVFGDCQLHIEWRTPAQVDGESQGRGNSGVFMQGIYEVQVLDNYNNRTYRNGQAGSIYKQNPPLVNACKAPGVWQTYDIIYTAPRFNEDGTYFTPPTITVLHNGVLVQNNVKMRGPTEYIGIPEYTVKKHGPGSIELQDHGNPVSFRNIWIREL